MKTAALILAALLQALPALAETRSASVYYFDHEYNLISDLAGALDEVIRSSSAIKLNRAATEITFTDGARFVIERPEDLTAEELNSTTDYADSGPVDILAGGHSVLVAPQGLLARLTPALEDKARAYFSVELRPGRRLTGTSPSGIKFTAVSLPHLAAKPLWEPTLVLRHFVSADGREEVFSSIPIPLGMNGISRKMAELAADKRSAVMLSLGAGGALAGSVLSAGPARTFKYLSDTGADIASLEMADLKNLWRWSREGGLKASSVPVEFICTNLKVSDPELARIIKPYALRNLGGEVAAFLSLVPNNEAVRAELRGAPFEVTDPADPRALQALITELRGNKKARLVVLISSLGHSDLGRLMGIGGIDALIGPKTWDNESGKRTRVDLRKWDKEAHTGPGIMVFPDSRGSGELRAEFGARGALTALEALPPPDDGREPLLYRENIYMKERIVRYFIGSGDALLPDISALGHGLFFGVRNFFNLAANITRKSFSTELAVLKVTPFGSNVAGDTPSAMVRSWLGPDEPLALVSAPGFFLKNFIRKAVPAGPREGEAPADYAEAEYFAVSGLDETGRVAGLPVNDSETYLAVLPESLIKDKPFIKRLPLPPGAPATLHEAVVSGLQAVKARHPSHPDWESAAWNETRNVTPPRDIWHLNLRNLSLEAVNTSITGPAAYSGVSESRLSADSQTRFQGSARLFSEYYSGKFRLDIGISADYGRTVLKPRSAPPLTTESVDQLVYQGELVYRMKNYNGKLGRLVIGPYASAAYDTEFSRADGAPLRKVLRGSAGLKLFEGAVMQELYAGLTTEQVYTYLPARLKHALEAGFRLSTPLRGTALMLNADGNYRRFARSRFDTVYDLKDRLDLNLKVSTRLYGDIMISPFVNYFWATGKKLTGAGANLTTGFALEYSKLFKIKR
ncbi:MAG TPA: hypothetical protein DEQ38_03725 [Elusimicrobia bacterium]|nr:MAG: hypothetical protein A2089_02920 [Elusimicrobia bacterium GWD2_63_28]HCC47213.1 hypothetical protein [Elusimicrobiota bacterium]